MKPWSTLPPRRRLLLNLDDVALATTLVPKPDRPMRSANPKITPRRLPLHDILIILERDHVDRPMATLCHAALVVLIRREVALDATLDRYFKLWETHSDLLLTHLSLRWLISASDTFADHGRTESDRVSGLAAALLVNTIKLYETERYFTEATAGPDEETDEGLPSFDLDCIVVFRVGHGVTIGNMYERKTRVLKDGSFAARVLDKAMQRVNELDTVYHRFRELQVGQKHKW